MTIELDDNEKELIRNALAYYKDAFYIMSDKFRQDLNIYSNAINKAKELEKLRYKFV